MSRDGVLIARNQWDWSLPFHKQRQSWPSVLRDSGCWILSVTLCNQSCHPCQGIPEIGSFLVYLKPWCLVIRPSVYPALGLSSESKKRKLLDEQMGKNDKEMNLRKSFLPCGYDSNMLFSMRDQSHFGLQTKAMRQILFHIPSIIVISVCPVGIARALFSYR